MSTRFTIDQLSPAQQAEVSAQLHGKPLPPPSAAPRRPVAVAGQTKPARVKTATGKPKAAKGQGLPRLTASQQRFLAMIDSSGLPAPVCEHRFHPSRKWRFDYAWPAARLALEVQGGIFVQGRHSRGAALLKEWEKLNTAAAYGYRVLFCQPADLCKADTLLFISAVLNPRLSP